MLFIPNGGGLFARLGHRTAREAGLVTTQRNGTTICYSIAPGPLARLGALIPEMASSAAAVPAS
jgi:ArsR family transcriptional regulator, arsenate/arsenite/antimonite-responsive transcriptional repressor